MNNRNKTLKEMLQKISVEIKEENPKPRDGQRRHYSNKNNDNKDKRERLEDKIPDIAFTHGSKFHADDVFSAALLTLLNPNIKIIRGFSVPETFEGIVFDIGGGEFDHHQADRRTRENGVPYAAFGLLWEKYGEYIVGKDEARRFDESFVQPLDYNDNTGNDNQLARVISYYNPTWDSKKSSDEAFHEAKGFALTILKNYVERAKSMDRARFMVEESIKNATDQIMELPVSAPWKLAVENTDIVFVIYPSNRGGYCAQAVNKDEDKAEHIKGKERELKCPFPVTWRGKSPEELKQISGVADLTFCHNSGFLISADSKAGARQACVKALDEQISSKARSNEADKRIEE